MHETKLEVKNWDLTRIMHRIKTSVGTFDRTTKISYMERIYLMSVFSGLPTSCPSAVSLDIFIFYSAMDTCSRWMSCSRTLRRANSTSQHPDPQLPRPHHLKKRNDFTKTNTRRIHQNCAIIMQKGFFLQFNCKHLSSASLDGQL